MEAYELAALVTGPGHEERFEFDGNGLLLYVGVAQVGTLTSAASWYVKKYSYTASTVTRIQTKRSVVWDNRTSSFS